jgi:hypothetical protein
MLNFAAYVERWPTRERDPVSVPLTPIERLMSEFLFYNEFASPQRPVVLMEGETDAVYLRTAMRSLAARFPTLVAPGTIPPKLMVKLVRHTPNWGRFFSLKGGSGGLLKFIDSYGIKYRAIKGPKGAQPVIVVLDNDSGAKELIATIKKKKYKATVSIGQQLIHVVDNLYVVLSSPYDPAAPHCIEDCFGAHTLATPLSGKTFNPGKPFDPATQYDKVWFANKVVKPNASTIDFSGFVDFLASIAGAIAANAARVATVPPLSLPPPSLKP